MERIDLVKVREELPVIQFPESFPNVKQQIAPELPRNHFQDKLGQYTQGPNPIIAQIVADSLLNQAIVHWRLNYETGSYERAGTSQAAIINPSISTVVERSPDGRISIGQKTSLSSEDATDRPIIVHGPLDRLTLEDLYSNNWTGDIDLAYFVGAVIFWEQTLIRRNDGTIGKYWNMHLNPFGCRQKGELSKLLEKNPEMVGQLIEDYKGDINWITDLGFPDVLVGSPGDDLNNSLLRRHHILTQSGQKSFIIGRGVEYNGEPSRQLFFDPEILFKQNIFDNLQNRFEHYNA